MLMVSGIGSFSEADSKREMHGLAGAVTKIKSLIGVYASPLVDVQAV